MSNALHDLNTRNQFISLVKQAAETGDRTELDHWWAEYRPDSSLVVLGSPYHWALEFGGKQFADALVKVVDVNDEWA